MLVVELIRTLRREPSTSSNEATSNADSNGTMGPLLAVVWVMALPLGAVLVGVYAGVAVFAGVFLYARREPLGVAVVGAAACGGLVWLLAGRLLQLTPPAGLITRLVS